MSFKKHPFFIVQDNQHAIMHVVLPFSHAFVFVRYFYHYCCRTFCSFCYCYMFLLFSFLIHHFYEYIVDNPFLYQKHQDHHFLNLLYWMDLWLCFFILHIIIFIFLFSSCFDSNRWQNQSIRLDLIYFLFEKIPCWTISLHIVLLPCEKIGLNMN